MIERFFMPAQHFDKLNVTLTMGGPLPHSRAQALPFRGRGCGRTNKNLPVKSFFTVIILLFTSFSCFSQNSKEDLEHKKEQLMKEIQSLQTELDQTKKSKKTNAVQLAAL